MTNREDEKVPRRKKAYAKPQIRCVVLRAEEAVLAACKTASKVGSGQAKCTFPSPCSSPGS